MSSKCQKQLRKKNVCKTSNKKRMKQSERRNRMTTRIKRKVYKTHKYTPKWFGKSDEKAC